MLAVSSMSANTLLVTLRFDLWRRKRTPLRSGAGSGVSGRLRREKRNVRRLRSRRTLSNGSQCRRRTAESSVKGGELGAEPLHRYRRRDSSGERAESTRTPTLVRKTSHQRRGAEGVPPQKSRTHLGSCARVNVAGDKLPTGTSHRDPTRGDPGLSRVPSAR